MLGDVTVENETEIAVKEKLEIDEAKIAQNEAEMAKINAEIAQNNAIIAQNNEKIAKLEAELSECATMQYCHCLLYWPGLIQVVTEVGH